MATQRTGHSERATGHAHQSNGSGAQPSARHDGYTREQASSREFGIERLAGGLGWFSIGLGAAQLLAARNLVRLVGAPETDTSRALTRIVGVREIAAGVGILSQRRPAGSVWARVGGDVMDLALLGTALTARKARQERLAAAAAAVIGVTIVDLLCAVALRRRTRQTESHDVHVKTITVNRSPDEVYRFWRDLENLPRFMSHLESVQTTGTGRSHWRAKAPAGTTVEWDAEIVEDRPNELIAWRSLAGAAVEHSGSVRFKPAPGGRGTEVKVVLEYAPPGGAIGATVTKLFGDEPGQQVQEDLRAFKQVLETGEVARSEASIHARPHAARPPADANRS